MRLANHFGDFETMFKKGSKKGESFGKICGIFV